MAVKQDGDNRLLDHLKKIRGGRGLEEEPRSTGAKRFVPQTRILLHGGKDRLDPRHPLRESMSCLGGEVTLSPARPAPARPRLSVYHHKITDICSGKVDSSHNVVNCTDSFDLERIYETHG